MEEQVQPAVVSEAPPSPRKASFFDPNPPFWRYALRMWLVAFLGAVAVAVLVSPLAGDWDPTEDGMPAWFFVLSALVIAPPVETLAMAIFFGIAGFIGRNVHRLSVASALCWGALHLVNAPVNAIAVVWPFYVMSRVYLAWRPLGFWKAFGVTMLIHGMNNTVPALAVLTLL
jgi:hypothetical protein